MDFQWGWRLELSFLPDIIKELLIPIRLCRHRTEPKIDCYTQCRPIFYRSKMDKCWQCQWNAPETQEIQLWFSLVVANPLWFMKMHLWPQCNYSNSLCYLLFFIKLSPFAAVWCLYWSRWWCPRRIFLYFLWKTVYLPTGKPKWDWGTKLFTRLKYFLLMKSCCQIFSFSMISSNKITTYNTKISQIPKW